MSARSRAPSELSFRTRLISLASSQDARAGVRGRKVIARPGRAPSKPPPSQLIKPSQIMLVFSGMFLCEDACRSV